MPLLTVIDWLQVALGAVVACLGLVVLVAARRDRPSPAALRWFDRLSRVTRVVLGMALVIVAYHIVVYALGLPQFRAPMPIVLVGAAVAVLGSAGVDAMEGGGESDKE